MMPAMKRAYMTRLMITQYEPGGWNEERMTDKESQAQAMESASLSQAETASISWNISDHMGI